MRAASQLDLLFSSGSSWSFRVQAEGGAGPGVDGDRAFETTWWQLPQSDF